MHTPPPSPTPVLLTHPPDHVAHTPASGKLRPRSLRTTVLRFPSCLSRGITHPYPPPTPGRAAAKPPEAPRRPCAPGPRRDRDAGPEENKAASRPPPRPSLPGPPRATAPNPLPPAAGGGVVPAAALQWGKRASSPRARRPPVWSLGPGRATRAPGASPCALYGALPLPSSHPLWRVYWRGEVGRVLVRAGVSPARGL